MKSTLLHGALVMAHPQYSKTLTRQQLSKLVELKIIDRVLERAGVLKKVIEQGFIPTDISWRKPNGDRIIDFEGLPRPTTGLPPFITLPVGSLSTLLLEEVQKQPSVTIHWAHTVSGLGQDEDQAWVEVTQQSTGATKRMKADFLIGCDGGTSNVRKSLFDSSFPGFTWPIKLVAANVSIQLPSSLH